MFSAATLPLLVEIDLSFVTSSRAGQNWPSWTLLPGMYVRICLLLRSNDASLVGEIEFISSLLKKVTRRSSSGIIPSLPWPTSSKYLQSGHAYRCFCSPDRLAQTRERLARAGLNSTYDKHCLSLSFDEVARRVRAGEKNVVRLNVSRAMCPSQPLNVSTDEASHLYRTRYSPCAVLQSQT
jgi:hypothetical protein